MNRNYAELPRLPKRPTGQEKYSCTVVYCVFIMGLLFKRNSEKREKFAHILAGIIILVHAYEKYDEHHSSYIFFLIAGVIFLSVALFHHRLIHRFHYVDGVFFIIEAFLYSIIAADFFHEGKKGLPWCYVVVAIAYCVVAVIKAKRGKKKYLAGHHKNITAQTKK